MKASETKLQPVLEGTKQYVVPLFQRTYSWESKEWETLWNDIVEIIDEGENRKHFIGSIVTMHTRSVPEGVSKHLLIDGQQRLTTLLILLAALRDKARSEPGTLADQIDDLLLKNRYQEGTDRYKILPTQADREAFFTALENSSESQDGQISRAQKYFSRKLQAAGAPSSDVLRKTIVENLTLVSISLDQDDNPYLIFESLNAKGKPLSQADLIRNYFFMRMHIDYQETYYASLWRPMQDELGSDLTEYIRHFLMRSGSVVKQSEVYLSLKDQADKLSNEAVVELLREISKFSQYYSRLLRPDLEPSKHLRERFHRLNRMQVTVAYPFLLNVLEDQASGRVSEGEFAEILDVLENFLMRRLVCSIPTTGLNKVFPLLFIQASQNPSLVEGVRDVLSTKNYPRDVEFHDRFVSSRFYGAGDRIDRTKLILEKLESSHGHKEEVSFEGLTIEHLMPQTLTDWWKDHLGEQWPIIHETLLDTIGNLTLTAYNSPLSNLDWSAKRGILSKSHVELNRYFQDCLHWREQDIRLRAEKLATVALEVWPFFGKSLEDGAQAPSTVTGRTPSAIVVLGQRIPATTWRDVAQQTIETIADLDPEKFELVAERFPRMVNADPSRMRSSRLLRNGKYIETHLSAEAIYRFCVQITELVDMSAEDWWVEFS